MPRHARRSSLVAGHVHTDSFLEANPAPDPTLNPKPNPGEATYVAGNRARSSRKLAEDFTRV